MKTAKKQLKEVLLREKKNPGRKNRESRREANALQRGAPIPAQRIAETKKRKASSRQELKRRMMKESAEE